MFCDHRNLLYIFAPDAELKAHIRGKLQRWALKFSEYRYTIEHIAGTNNLWADMVSRWAGPQPPVTTQCKRLRTRKRKRSMTRRPPPTASVLRPLDDAGFVWPTLVSIRAAQLDANAPQFDTLTEDSNGLLCKNGRIWIPTGATELRQRLYVIAHCGSQGHRGKDAMTAHLGQLFYIPQLSKDVTVFLRNCLLCQHTKGGKIVPRPWSETFRCMQPNGALHMDFLYVGKSFGEAKYLLALKDDATHFCELTVCDSPTSAVVVEAILGWHSRFGIPPVWISDNGSHFKNEVMAEVNRRLKSQQQFTLAYSPWINGSIERINRDILQVLRTMILEYKLDTRDWVYLIPMVQSSLNHTKVPSLSNYAPSELFTGQPCPSPLRTICTSDALPVPKLPDDSAKLTEYLTSLQKSLQEMHKQVLDEREKRTLLNQRKSRGANVVNFSVGDYVLRSRVDEKYVAKLLVTWIGPYRVIRADPYSFTIEHLITGEQADVHASRLKFYADVSFDVTEEILEHVAAQGIVLAIDQLLEHRYNVASNEYEILVSWRGLETIEDSWEPLMTLHKDVRVLVQRYVEDCADPSLLAAVHALE
jgi:hypothetical protein